MTLLFNISVDGHSSCGKSTISKSIAKKYKMRYIDTGAMYRAVTLFCLNNNIIKNKKVNVSKLNNEIDKISIDFKYNNNDDKVLTLLNGKNVEKLIRNFLVSENVSYIAKIPLVRHKLVKIQQKIGESKNIVMDGRDIGTKVFPDARLKLFITASPEIRAKRRMKQIVANGEKVDFNQILSSIKQRDYNDMHREINPLVQAEDAIVIDNSKLSLTQQNDIIYNLINQIIDYENNNR